MQIAIAVMIAILCILVLLVALALFVPVRLIARSRDHHYAWQWGKLIRGKFIPNMDDPVKSVLNLKILFWEIALHPFRKRKGKEKGKGQEKKKRKGKAGFSFLKRNHIRSRLVPILNTFQVESFRVNIDTDDYALNGILYPVFLALSTDKRSLEINFNGIVDLEVNVRNHGWRLFYAFFR